MNNKAFIFRPMAGLFKKSPAPVNFRKAGAGCKLGDGRFGRIGHGKPGQMTEKLVKFKN